MRRLGEGRGEWRSNARRGEVIRGGEGRGHEATEKNWKERGGVDGDEWRKR